MSKDAQRDGAKPAAVRPDDAPPSSAEAREGSAGGSLVEGSPRRVRFPYARVAIAAVGVVLSVWLWVGESWRFDVTPKELLHGSPGWGWKGGWVGRYVAVPMPRPKGDSFADGRFLFMQAGGSAPMDSLWFKGTLERVQLRWKEDGTVEIVGERSGGGVTSEAAPGKAARFPGRVVTAKIRDREAIVLDFTRGRWTGKSVLAVFVFLWGVGIVVSSVWMWKRKCGAAAAVACDDAPAKPD